MEKPDSNVTKNLVGAGELNNKIYVIRGRQVMLDFDLAEFYGYTTGAFNQQVQRNMEKFEGEDFMFRLSRAEMGEVVLRSDLSKAAAGLMSQNVISIQTKGVRGGRTKLPYAFTEQGIYMLMTVLKGDLAVRQSRALVMMFKEMKDYIAQNREILDEKDQLKMLTRVAENSRQISEIENEIGKIEDKLGEVSDKMNNVVMRSEIAPVLLDFKKLPERREYLFLNGQPMTAKSAYLDIYERAKKNIIVIDDYIDIRSLRLLGQVVEKVKIIIFSDNSRRYLHKSDYDDFRKEFKGREIQFYQTRNKVHDRFIVVDYRCDGEKIFHCGTSSKDAGNRIMAIVEFEDNLVKKTMHGMIEIMLQNPRLNLD